MLIKSGDDLKVKDIETRNIGSFIIQGIVQVGCT